jgi:methylenetetrahydrofolate dehydrogenase (NADP+)/methenyltetrahydrofolate cyclohydrolase
MTAILDGAAVAANIHTRLAATCAALTAGGTTPTLAVVTATDDPVTDLWTRTLARTAERTGLRCRPVTMGPQATAADIRATLTGLSDDPLVHGIVLQTPLPPGIVLDTVTDAIAVGKDVDGANPLSAGRLARDLPAFAPAIARAVVTLLNHHRIEIGDRRVVVIGRSSAVGKPIADLLLQRNATVTICHRHTTDLAEITRTADIVVAAAGHPGLITGEHVHPGAVLIDVGMNVTGSGGLIGDVDQASVSGLVAALTPVPGGVGLVTTAMLLDHTLRAVTRD